MSEGLEMISNGGSILERWGLRPEAGEDFYRHVNHAWLTDKSIVIPDEYPLWGSTVQLVDESLKNQIALLKELPAQPSNEDERMLSLVYRASMRRFEEWERGEGSHEPVVAELRRFKEALTSGGPLEGLAQYFARCRRVGISIPFDFDKLANLEASNDLVLDLSPSGLSLPTREYYLDDKFAEKREWFMAHLSEVAELIGADLVQEDFAARVLRFETKLAKIRMSPPQSRQFDRYYTLTTLDDLVPGIGELKHLAEKEANYEAHESDPSDPDNAVLTSPKAPALGGDVTMAIRKFLEVIVNELGLRERQAANFAANYPDGDKAATHRMMVFDGDYFRRVFTLLFRPENRDDLVAYVQYSILRSGSDYCTKELNEAFFDFYMRKLRGQKEQKGAEKRTVALVNAWIGEVMSKRYVKRHFSPKDKDTVKGMIHEVLEVMEGSIRANDWLTEPTKAKALRKLDTFMLKIGYPDKWRDYSALKLEEGDTLFEMNQKVCAFKFEDDFMSKLNTVKDRTEWRMLAQTVNAYYSPLENCICFPSGIISSPFYIRSPDELEFPVDLEARGPAPDPELVTLAANFGGIGAVIAHEITHGYDDRGRKFDHEGNMNDWWQPEDAELFTAKSKVMGAQAELYSFTDSNGKEHRLNGDLTMGENLADLGGMSLALQALVKELGKRGIKPDSPTGLTLLEVFYRNWANIHRSKLTEAFIVNQLATDPHSPDDFRANLVKNSDLFYEVFDIKPGSPMFLAPEDRVRMW